MNKLRLFFLGILICIVPNVLAADWYEAYSDDDVTIFVYSEYKKTSEGYKIWTEWNFNSPQKIGDHSYIYFKDYSEYSFDFDKTKTLSTTYYDKKGEVVEMYTPSFSTWNYIVPGSRGHAVADFIADMINDL